ncbi:MAG: hypothetical protein AAFY26_19205 [Cyanobacteria bacterium J06638_22]
MRDLRAHGGGVGDRSHRDVVVERGIDLPDVSGGLKGVVGLPIDQEIVA